MKTPITKRQIITDNFSPDEANLLLTAPDMYEALTNLLQRLDNNVLLETDLSLARAAITKAEGK